MSGGGVESALGVAATGIGRVLVIGAGAMGGGIAAQFANAGVPVDLLDVSREAAQAGIERQIKAGGFMVAEAAHLVRPGAVGDDLGRATGADWIVEVIVEDLAAKRALFTRLAAVKRPGVPVTSNTSTLRLADLAAGVPGDFTRDLAVTHFFNPPRAMPLVELIGGAATAPEVLARLREGCETILGKTVIDCRDTPGFIANRIGCYWIAMGILEAARQGVTIEEAEAVNIAMGTPKSGVFGCLDIIGLDLVRPVWGSLLASLPAGDDLHRFDLTADPLIARLVAEGHLGRKARAGFSRRTAGGTEVVDLVTGAYRPSRPVALPGGGRDLAALLAAEGPVGAYARALVGQVVAYAATHAPEIASDVEAVDAAMRLGYGWKSGPFALADRLGLTGEDAGAPPLLSAARAAGGFHTADGPLRSDGQGRAPVLAAPGLLAQVKVAGPRLWGNETASVWDLGGGAVGFELTTKMNCLDPAIFDVLEETLMRAPRALVLGSDHPRAFSVGADLGFLNAMLAEGGHARAEAYVARGQRLFLAMKRAPFPVVAAVQGFALGGGCEFALHADAVVAQAEARMGLPEVKVGLIPAWGGCTQLLLRAQQGAGAGPRGPMAAARGVFRLILSGEFSGSAADARARGYLRPGDGIVMHPGHRLAAARDRALAMVPAYAAPEPALLTVGGPSARAGLMAEVRAQAAAGAMTGTDVAMADTLAGVLTGGPEGDPLWPVTEEALMDLERAALFDLFRRPSTQARIDHMLATGKPLRN